MRYRVEVFILSDVKVAELCTDSIIMAEKFAEDQTKNEWFCYLIDTETNAETLYI